MEALGRMWLFDDSAPRERTMVVAEVGNVHDGSLGNAHALIDAVADAGCDAVKFQCHIADAESSDAEGWPQRFQFHPQDATRKAYWKRMEFTLEQWQKLSSHAHRRGLKFIVSVFSIDAVRQMQALADWLKVPSGEIDNLAVIAAIAEIGRPIIISTGMADINAISKAVVTYNPPTRDSCIVLQCTTEYPCPPELIGLNWSAQFSRNIIYKGGLSDHSGTIWPSICAATLGAHMVEVHVAWHKQQFGADVCCSLTPEELRQLVEGVRWANMLLASPTVKEDVLEKLSDVAVYRNGKQRVSFDYIRSAVAGMNRD